MLARLSSIIQSLLVEHLPITLVVVLGLAAIYLLLPRPRGYPPLWGAVAGAAALLLAGVLVVHAGAFTPETLLFYVFSALAVIAGALLITQQNPARAALAFALVVLSTCGLFLLLAAPFLMAATVIIYAGAIIVTFLFVIMLAQQEGLSNADQRSREPLLASFAGFLLLGALLYALGQSYRSPHPSNRIQQVQEFVIELDSLPPGSVPSTDWMNRLDELLRKFREGDTETPSARTLGGEVLDAAVVDAEDALAVQQHNQEIGRPVQWNELRDRLTRLRAAAGEAASRVGTFQPPEGTSLSNLSGPPPNQELRRDAQGRPELPAENVAYLGRSLFTDYLIAVELAGTLLLVATIGAIAIANRRAEGRT